MNPQRRLALRAGCAGLGAWALPQAQASFEATDWPRRTPTPPLDALDLSGRRLTLADFTGRVLVLNFWASWCEPCRAEMPTLQQLPEVLGEDRVAVLGLNFKEGPRKIAQFVQAAAVTLPIALDPQGLNARAWDVRVFPSTLIVDPAGRARQRIRGEVDWSSPQALAWIERWISR